jgi:hypothetical protein
VEAHAASINQLMAGCMPCRTYDTWTVPPGDPSRTMVMGTSRPSPAGTMHVNVHSLSTVGLGTCLSMIRACRVAVGKQVGVGKRVGVGRGWWWLAHARDHTHRRRREDQWPKPRRLESHKEGAWWLWCLY